MPLAAIAQHIQKNAVFFEAVDLRPIEEQLHKSIKIRGSFPTSLHALQSLQKVVQSERLGVPDVVDAVCQDSLLALRLIAIVNHSFYSRSSTITSVHGAVSHLGMLRIHEIASDLSASKSFRAIFLGRAVAAVMYHELLLSESLARRLVSLLAGSQGQETLAQNITSLVQLPLALLAFLKPHMYSALYLDWYFDERSYPSRRFKKIFRKTTTQVAAELASSLGLPEFFSRAVYAADVPPWNRRVRAMSDEAIDASGATYLALRLARKIMHGSNVSELEALIRDVAAKTRMSSNDIREAMGEALADYRLRVDAVGLPFLRLPDFLGRYIVRMVDIEGEVGEDPLRLPPLSERVNPFLYELKACLKTKSSEGEFPRFPQAVNCTLQALLRGTNFDRAVFFLHNKDENALVPTVVMGEKVPQIEAYKRYLASLADSHAPDVNAFWERKTLFQGDPIFGEAWPFAAFPAVWCDQVLGVFYADKKEEKDPRALDIQEQVAVIALAEEWQDIPMGFC